MNAAYAIDALEVAASILQPHFDAVRDVFAAHVVDLSHARLLRADSTRLSKAGKVRFVIDPSAHDTARHFAATRDDGLQMYFAPEFVDLPVETVTAILAHEFGHACDFLYPGHWLMPAHGPGKAQWIGPPGASREAHKWLKLWRARPRDQVEWAADGIAQAVTGKSLGYSGDCMLQTFRGGVPRPKGLR
jgi:hypothetical protein